MGSTSIIAFIVVVLFVFAYYIYTIKAKETKYAEGMRKFAKRNGMRVVERFRDDNYVIFKSCFAACGGKQRIKNMVRGDLRGYKIDLFDFVYEVGDDDKGGQTRMQTVLAVRGMEALPDFYLKSKKVANKTARTAGIRNIDLASYPILDKLYTLRGKASDETAIRKIFDKKVISLFEQIKCLSVESIDGYLLVWHDNVRQRLVNIDNFVTLSLTVAQSFKQKKEQ